MNYLLIIVVIIGIILLIASLLPKTRRNYHKKPPLNSEDVQFIDEQSINDELTPEDKLLISQWNDEMNKP